MCAAPEGMFFRLRGTNIRAGMSSEALRRVDLNISVEYGTQVDTVKQALEDIIKADGRILTDPEPFVALGNLASSSIDFTVRTWVKGADYWPVYFDLTRTVYEEFNRRGIGFPFPQVQIHQ